MEAYLKIYVPFLTGQLMGSSFVRKIDNKHVQLVYPVPYAQKQFIGIGRGGVPFNYTKQSHPMARSQWTEMLSPDVMNKLEEAAARKVDFKKRMAGLKQINQASKSSFSSQASDSFYNATSPYTASSSMAALMG